MDLNFKLNASKTHFNATLILSQVNQDFATKKRLNDFAIQSKIRLTSQWIDGERVTRMNKEIEYRPGVKLAKKVRIPSISVVGGGKSRCTWMHISLLPLFLHWCHPQVYARFFTEPRVVARLSDLAVSGQI